MRLRFGEITFDPEARLILRGPEPVHLTAKALDLLAILLKERPRALSREQLIESLWGETFVSESNLTSLVNDVRTAIGDDAKHPTFVRTHHGFGYSFAAEVLPEPAARPGREGVRCWLVWGLNVLHLSAGENVLGRDPDAPIWIGDPSVSRRHARILVEGEIATLEDLGSKNGTCVEGRRLEGRVTLPDGASIRLGHVDLVFHAASASSSTVSAN